jgi:TonB family protein
MFGVTDQPKKSKAPLAIAAAVILAIVGVGGWLVMRPTAKPGPSAAAAPKPQAPPPPKVQMIPTAVVAATTTAPATTAADPAAQQKAFEAAVEQKLQQEMMKLQADYTKNLQKTQSKNAPVQIAAAAPIPTTATAASEEHAPPSAAALDEKRLTATRQETPAAPAPTQTSAPAPAPITPTVVPASVPAPQVAQVREGDVIDYNELDSPVTPLSAIRPAYPPLAMRSKIESSIIVTTLIDENGNVVDVKVLRGDERFGFNEAAVRAMRGTRFSHPTKNGRRVKTWRPQMIAFKL